MNILVTNDDGLYTPGIWTLAEAMTAVGTVTVIAPDREQSGVGAAVTIQHPVRISEVMPRIEGIKAYSVEGTPGDCVILAMQGIMPKPDLVVSGINEGANTGIYVMMSGTVGAAVHANLWARPRSPSRWSRSPTCDSTPRRPSGRCWGRCSSTKR